MLILENNSKEVLKTNDLINNIETSKTILNEIIINKNKNPDYYSLFKEVRNEFTLIENIKNILKFNEEILELNYKDLNFFEISLLKFKTNFNIKFFYLKIEKIELKKNEFQNLISEKLKIKNQNSVNFICQTMDLLNKNYHNISFDNKVETNYNNLKKIIELDSQMNLKKQITNKLKNQIKTMKEKIFNIFKKNLKLNEIILEKEKEKKKNEKRIEKFENESLVKIRNLKQKIIYLKEDNYKLFENLGIFQCFCNYKVSLHKI